MQESRIASSVAKVFCFFARMGRSVFFFLQRIAAGLRIALDLFRIVVFGWRSESLATALYLICIGWATVGLRNGELCWKRSCLRGTFSKIGAGNEWLGAQGWIE